VTVQAPSPWQQWDLHPSVIIGLVLLGGLFVYWGGLAAPRRRIASFAAALAVLSLALNGPLHNLSDSYLFSAHMAQHLVLTLLPDPPPVPVWLPLLEILGLIPHDLVEQSARLVRVVVGCNHPRASGRRFLVPQAARPKGIDNVVLRTACVAVHQDSAIDLSYA